MIFCVTIMALGWVNHVDINIIHALANQSQVYNLPLHLTIRPLTLAQQIIKA